MNIGTSPRYPNALEQMIYFSACRTKTEEGCVLSCSCHIVLGVLLLLYSPAGAGEAEGKAERLENKATSGGSCSCVEMMVCLLEKALWCFYKGSCTPILVTCLGFLWDRLIVGRSLLIYGRNAAV